MSWSTLTRRSDSRVLVWGGVHGIDIRSDLWTILREGMWRVIYVFTRRCYQIGDSWGSILMRVGKVREVKGGRANRMMFLYIFDGYGCTYERGR